MEYLLSLNLFEVILIVFTGLTIASELGLYFGKLVRKYFIKENKEEIDDNQVTIINSSLGLLALFLGFTFSSALQHFEDNRNAVINESNAIKTFLIIQNTMSGDTTKLKSDIIQYTQLRILKNNISQKEILEIQDKTNNSLNKITNDIREYKKANNKSEILDKLTEAVIELSKTSNERTDRLLNGVPNGLFIPVGIFLIFNGFIMGLSLSDSKNRHIALSLCLYFLISLSVAIIIDIDRPLNGLIDVEQISLEKIIK